MEFPAVPPLGGSSSHTGWRPDRAPRQPYWLRTSCYPLDC